MSDSCASLADGERFCASDRCGTGCFSYILTLPHRCRVPISPAVLDSRAPCRKKVIGGVGGSAMFSRIKSRVPASLALAGMVLAPASLPSAAAPPGIQTKVVKIYNNTPDKLYAIIEIGKHDPIDEWMQGYFQTTNVKRDSYASARVYRVYVNPDKGI